MSNTILLYGIELQEWELLQLFDLEEDDIGGAQNILNNLCDTTLLDCGFDDSLINYLGRYLENIEDNETRKQFEVRTEKLLKSIYKKHKKILNQKLNYYYVNWSIKNKR